MPLQEIPEVSNNLRQDPQVRCRANMEHVRQSRPDSGFRVQVRNTFQVAPLSLGCEGGTRPRLREAAKHKELLRKRGGTCSLPTVGSGCVGCPWAMWGYQVAPGDARGREQRGVTRRRAHLHPHLHCVEHVHITSVCVCVRACVYVCVWVGGWVWVWVWVWVREREGGRARERRVWVTFTRTCIAFKAWRGCGRSASISAPALVQT